MAQDLGDQNGEGPTPRRTIQQGVATRQRTLSSYATCTPQQSPDRFRPRAFPRDLPNDAPTNSINSEQGLDTNHVTDDVEARRVTPNRNRPIAHNTDLGEDDIFSDDSVMD
ncbi:hypothetical protein DPMN_029196 [Dreissena polymorpha]|uniref:Uncharacterized protein n=1 Tax=Dreissena polymorpha TaxID=45954 RepID=A0A9D4M0C1_DREPO|nr:hypothetical protein DPMN_029196 [Dreissena polymorpha]